MGSGLFAVFGAVLMLGGFLALVFARRMDEWSNRRWPPPERNRAETLKIRRFHAWTLVVVGALMVLAWWWGP
jgi:hypothetical protein